MNAIPVKLPMPCDSIFPRKPQCKLYVIESVAIMNTS